VFTSTSVGIALGTKAMTSQKTFYAMLTQQCIVPRQARYEVFDTAMHDHVVTLQLETSPWWAVERQEFRIHYQPIVLLETSRIVGFEACALAAPISWPLSQLSSSQSQKKPERLSLLAIVPVRHAVRCAWKLQFPETIVNQRESSSKQFSQTEQLNISAKLYRKLAWMHVV